MSLNSEQHCKVSTSSPERLSYFPNGHSSWAGISTYSHQTVEAEPSTVTFSGHWDPGMAQRYQKMWSQELLPSEYLHFLTFHGLVGEKGTTKNNQESDSRGRAREAVPKCFLLIWTLLVLRKYFVSKIADAFPRGNLEQLAIHLMPKMHCSCGLGGRRAIPEPAGGRWPPGRQNCQDKISSFLLMPRYLCLGLEGTKWSAGREGFPLFISLSWNC